MSLSRWKRLAQRRTQAGKAVNELYDDITEEKIRSKTTDAAIAKTFLFFFFFFFFEILF